MSTPTSFLSEIDACSEARKWVKAGKFKSLETAWLACDKPDWLLWYAARMAGGIGSESRRKIIMIACECADLSIANFEKVYPDDRRPRTAIETARRFVDGLASLEDVRAAESAWSAAESAAESARSAAESAWSAAESAAWSAEVKIIKKHYPSLPKKEDRLR